VLCRLCCILHRRRPRARPAPPLASRLLCPLAALPECCPPLRVRQYTSCSAPQPSSTRHCGRRRYLYLYILSTISVHIEHLLGVVCHREVRSLEHAARPCPGPRLLANPSLLRRRSSRRWTQRCASSCRRWASPPAGAALPPALSAAGGLTCARGLTCACSWRPHMRWPRSCLPAGGLACASALLRHGLPRVAAHNVWLPESAHQRLSYRPPCTCAIERAASHVLRSASLAAAFTHLGVR